MKVIDIAKACHNANKMYCELIGDNSQKDWDETPKNIQKSAISGVEHHLKNPNLTPEQSHEAWCRYKEKEGWQWGPQKDIKAKLHPSLLAYNKLPITERVKDMIFKSVVTAMAPYLGLETVADAGPTDQDAAPNDTGEVDLDSLSKKELYELAKDLEGVNSKTSKSDLLEILKKT
jgi:hypothetical protein